MNTSRLKFVAAGVMLLTALLSAPAESSSKPSWKVTGELEEGCSCHAPCGCWFKSLPSRMTCDGVQIVFINKGHYGKTSLNGLAMAQFVQSPEGKSMFESFGNWNFDNVYIDERATEEQREALREIAAHFFPVAAKMRQFHYTSISRRIEGAEHISTVGNVGVCSGHLIEGGYGGSPKLTNPPLADPTHKEYFQGETTKLTYNDAGQGWKYEGSNYMRNKISVTDREYAKYEKELARKMASMKDAK